jgi:hypothetical protein
MRVLSGRFTEIDLSDLDAKEKMRSAPILDERSFSALWDKAPKDVNAAIIAQDSAEPDPTQATQPASAGPRPR